MILCNQKYSAVQAQSILSTCLLFWVGGTLFWVGKVGWGIVLGDCWIILGGACGWGWVGLNGGARFDNTQHKKNNLKWHRFDMSSGFYIMLSHAIVLVGIYLSIKHSLFYFPYENLNNVFETQRRKLVPVKRKFQGNNVKLNTYKMIITNQFK